MKIGKMFRWYWQNTYWGLVGFYGAMLFLMLLGFVIMAFSSTEEVSVNGFAFPRRLCCWYGDYFLPGRDKVWAVQRCFP